MLIFIVLVGEVLLLVSILFNPKNTTLLLIPYMIMSLLSDELKKIVLNLDAFGARRMHVLYKNII